MFIVIAQGHSYYDKLASIPAWLSKYIHYEVWDEMSYSFPIFHGCTVYVGKWLSKFTHTLKGKWLFTYTGIKVKPC